MKSTLLISAMAAALIAGAPGAFAEPPAKLEDVAQLYGPMPTGVTVAPNGRMFVNFPQWGDNPPFAVGEVTDGKVVAYPDGPINTPDAKRPAETFLSVQSVVADGANRLWVLDTASPGFQSPQPGGAKLVAIDLATSQVVRTIVFSPDVILPTTYLNDVRFDLRQGKAGVAYITDSSTSGPGAIIVVDLATGTALRRLSGHPSTMPDPGFIAVVDGKPLMKRAADGTESPLLVAADGIAIAADGETLYYCPLSSRRLYAVPTRLLRDPAFTDAEIATHVRDLGEKGTSDGLAEDDRGRLYAGDYEHDAVRRYADGQWETIAEGPAIAWPDTFSVGTDGYLYFTANQLNRQAVFNGGHDGRVQPYHIYRIAIGAGPVLLK